MDGAIIGFGFIAEGHLYAYSKLECFKIKAIVDINEKRLKIARQKIPGVRCYNSFDSLIANEKIEFIDVCTPPYCRYEYIKRGLETKLHVIGEKPFLLDWKEYDSLCKIAIDNNVILFPSHNYVFAPIINKAKDLLTQSLFGDVLTVHFRTLRASHAKGCAEWNTNWRRYKQYSGGGIIQDHGPHSIYLVCHILKKWPLAVSCISGRFIDNDLYDTEDTAWITLYFENDLQVKLDLSWASQHRNTQYAFYGSNRNVIIENDSITFSENNLVYYDDIESNFDDPSHKEWFIGVLKEFYSSVISNSFRWDLIKSSFVTVASIAAAYESSYGQGEIISLPPFPFERNVK